MSDTDYFEAKPRRAVGLEEIKAVLLPMNASERVKNALIDKGIQFTQYDVTDVNARRDIIEKIDDVSFSRKRNLIDMYTETQYNDFGWVRANELVTYRQWADFDHKFENMTEEVKRNQTRDGEYMIAVNDMKDKKFGVDNVIIFAKGTPLHPVVTKIIKINLENETEIEFIREVIYEGKFDDTENAVFESVYGEGYFEEYHLRDVDDYQTYKRKRGASNGGEEGDGTAGNNRTLQDGRRDTLSDSNDGKSDSEGDDGRRARVRSYWEDRVNGIGKGQSIQKSVSGTASINRRADSADGRGLSDDSLSPRNGRGGSEVCRVGGEQIGRRQIAGDGNGNSAGGGPSGKRSNGLKLSGEERHFCKKVDRCRYIWHSKADKKGCG